MINIELNMDLFLYIIFVMYVLLGIVNILNGMFKTKKNQSAYNGFTEIAAGVLMIVICIAVVLL